LYGPVPQEARVVGTRTGGTVGRLLGGTSGYLIGGIVGAAADIRAEAKKYEHMSDGQRQLLQQIRRISLVSPILTSTFMVGALLMSWVFVVVYEMVRAIVGA
jgi:membrane protein YqaA with SNARE-associated domain